MGGSFLTSSDNEGVRGGLSERGISKKKQIHLTFRLASKQSTNLVIKRQNNGSKGASLEGKDDFIDNGSISQTQSTQRDFTRVLVECCNIINFSDRVDSLFGWENQ